MRTIIGQADNGDWLLSKRKPPHVVYAYRTTADRGGWFAAIVTRVENGLVAYVSSRSLHPTRNRAYEAARHIARLQAKTNGVGFCAYDKL